MTENSFRRKRRNFFQRGCVANHDLLSDFGLCRSLLRFLDRFGIHRFQTGNPFSVWAPRGPSARAVASQYFGCTAVRLGDHELSVRGPCSQSQRADILWQTIWVKSRSDLLGGSSIQHHPSVGRNPSTVFIGIAGVSDVPQLRSIGAHREQIQITICSVRAARKNDSAKPRHFVTQLRHRKVLRGKRYRFGSVWTFSCRRNDDARCTRASMGQVVI